MIFTGTALLTCLACLATTSSAVELPGGLLDYVPRLTSDASDQARDILAAHLSAQEAHARVQALHAASHSRAQEALARVQARLAAAHSSAQEGYQSTIANLASGHLSSQEAQARARDMIAAAHLSAQEAQARAQASIAAAHLSAQEAQTRAQARLAAAHLSAQEAQARAHATIGDLAVFASQPKLSSSTSYTLKKSRVTISRHVGPSKVRPPRIIVRDAAASGLVCVPRGAIDASEAVTGSGTAAEGEAVEEAAGGVQVTDSGQSGKLVGEELHKSVTPVQTIGQGQGIVVTVDGISSTSVSSGQRASASTGHGGATASTGHGGVTASTGHGGATASTGHGGATASTGHGGATASTGHGGATASTGHGGATALTGHGGATASTGHGGATASTGHGGVSASTGHEGPTASTGHEGASVSVGYDEETLSTEQEASESIGHEEFVSTQGQVVTEHGEDFSTGAVLDVTSSNGPEASAIKTISSVEEYPGAHGAALVSGNVSSTVAGHVQTSSGRGVSVSAGGATASTGGATASTGGATASTGGAAASTGGATASTGGAAASTGGATASTGGATASAGGATASAGGATASAGGATASAGGATASAGGATASAGGATASAGGATASAGGSRATASSGHGAFASSHSDHSASTSASSAHHTSATSNGSSGSYSATLSGGKLLVSSPTGGVTQSHRASTDTYGEHGSAAAAGDGYAHTSSSGSGSSSASSVGSDGRVSLDVSGQHAEAAAVGADGSALHLSSAGGLSQLALGGCECVAEHLCDEDGFINTSGAGTIDIRSFSLGGQAAAADARCGANRVCCRHHEERAPLGWAPLGCGTRAPFRLDARVVSGGATRLGEFPWTTAVQRVVPAAAGAPQQHEYLCGGSLIAPNVVLTAAHCVDKYRSGRLVARVGEWDTGSADAVYPHQDLAVAEVVIHPQFDADKLWYDAALLRLETPAELSAHVNTICLPADDDYYIDYSDCFATGWGQESFDKAVYSSLLKKVPLSKVDSGQCEARMRQTRLGAWFRLHETFLCAGGHPRVDTCTGDGGSPLVCRDTSPRHGDEETFVQIGIVAWGINCQRGGFPGVYADVLKLLPWIRSALSVLTADAPAAVY